MEGFRKFWFLGAFACICLVAASVWLGGLNQDEGWYLYAANLVADGKMLYRDFFYTQGPLLPLVYSPFKFIWESFGLLGGRVFTALFGIAGILAAVLLSTCLAPPGKERSTRLTVFLLLGCNLYHLYFVSIPKTYALAAFFVALGYWFYSHALTSDRVRRRYTLFAVSGALLALAAGARISLALLLPAAGLVLLFSFSRYRWGFLFFGIGGFIGLFAVYGVFLCDAGAFEGLCEAQKYHAARGGFSPVLVIGSLSRLVRWYLPVFIIAGLGLLCGGFSDCLRRAPHHVRSMVLAMLTGSLAVIALQMSAPCPYEDYQVPLMGVLTVVSVAAFNRSASLDPLLSPVRAAWLVLGLSFGISFGSPLLEDWMTDGQDRFWTIRKEKCELALLRDAAREIERLDPGGKTLLTQDIYLAVETGRKVPDGLEMGPFSIMGDDAWRRLLVTTDCPVAALSGYTFAVDPPACGERPIAEQIEFWNILKSRYEYSARINRFGQNSTTLLLLSLRSAPAAKENATP